MIFTIRIDRSRYSDACDVTAFANDREVVKVAGVSAAMIEETVALVAKRVGIELAKALADQLGVGA